MRTGGVHSRESAGTRSVNLKVVPITSASFAGHHGPINVRLSSPAPTIGTVCSGHVESIGGGNVVTPKCVVRLWLWGRGRLSGGCRAGLTVKRDHQLGHHGPINVRLSSPAPTIGTVCSGHVESIGGGWNCRVKPCSTRNLRGMPQVYTVARFIGRVSTRFGADGVQLDRWQARGVLNYLCARIYGATRESSEGKADWWPRSVSFLRWEPARSGKRTKYLWWLSGRFRTLSGCWIARRLRSSRPRPRWTSVQRFSIWACWWSVICWLCCWESFGLGGWRKSDSIGDALDMEKEVWWPVLTLVGAIAWEVGHRLSSFKFFDMQAPRLPHVFPSLFSFCFFGDATLMSYFRGDDEAVLAAALTGFTWAV